MKKLALFLALCMLVQAVGLTAFAEGADQELIPEVPVSAEAAPAEEEKEAPAAAPAEEKKEEAAAEAQEAPAEEAAAETEVKEAADEKPAEEKPEAVEAAEEAIEEKPAENADEEIASEEEPAEEILAEEAAADDEEVIEVAPAEAAAEDAEIAAEETEEVPEDAVEVLDEDEMLYSAISGSAEFTWRIISGTNCEITECRSDSTDIVIPNSFVDSNGITYTVTQLSETAFARNTNITTVLLDAAISLTSISAGCFEGCTALRSISFAPGAPLSAIPDNAFKDCSSLASVSWTININTIGANAFENCSALTTLTLPNNLLSIDASAFEGCTGLQSVSMPATLQTIGKRAFAGCSSIVNAILNNGLTSIGDSAFINCLALKGIYIPSSVTYLGSSAFENCSAATELDLNGLTITEINNFTFKDCSSLSNILYIPDTVKRIGREAFSGCSNIHTVFLCDSLANFSSILRLGGLTNLDTIGAGAFENLASDSVVLMPPANTYTSVHITIGSGAFSGVSKLYGWYGSTTETYCANNLVQFVSYSVVKFMEIQYHAYFGRAVDIPSLLEDAPKLSNGTLTAGAYLTTLLSTSEFTSHNTTNAAMVTALLNGMYNSAYGTAPGYPTQLEGEYMLRDGVSILYVANQALNTTFFRDSVCANAGIVRGAISLTQNRDQNRNITAFVARCYINLMGRSVDLMQKDPDGLNYWAGRLLNGSATGAIVVASFLRSSEWAEQVASGMTTTQQVQRLYLTMMDRAADATGLAYWDNGFLQTDFVSIEYVAKGFVDSMEFRWICGNHGIPVGTYVVQEPRDKDIEITRMVTRCYQYAFGRTPDINGLNYWTDALLTRQVTGRQMVTEFVMSYEMTLNSDWYLQNSMVNGWVATLYRCFLTHKGSPVRTPESLAAVTYWNTVATTQSRQAVVDGFANSAEFAQILNEYGIR